MEHNYFLVTVEYNEVNERSDLGWKVYRISAQHGGFTKICYVEGRGLSTMLNKLVR